VTRVVPGGSWIKGFQYWMQESEAPDSFIIWAAISAISGATQRKIRISFDYYEYFTNMYILFVGPPGIVHKSTVIHEIRKMYWELNIPTTSESLTREELINQMITRNNGLVAAMTAMPDELSDFLKKSGPEMAEFLTSIYNCPEKWEYSTRARGIETIEKAFLNVLGGTTPSWIADNFDQHFMEGGYAARTIFIHELEPRFTKYKPKVTPEMRKVRKLLLEDLAHIASLEGEFEWEPEADVFMEHWYNNENPKDRRAADYKLKHYFGRKNLHVHKLAMVLQLEKSDELIITKKNLEQSLLLLRSIETSMAHTFSAVGRNVYASDLERIHAEIQEAGASGLPMSAIMGKNYSALPGIAFEEQLKMLRIMKKIRRELKDGEEWFYPIPGKEN
jgi:hypothetical protein